MKIIQAFNQELLDKIYALYMGAFPKEERKPFPLMVQLQENGQMVLYALENDSGEFMGLAIFMMAGDLVLLDYFAIEPEFREKGVGSEALRQLQQMFPGKRFFLEIESTYEDCADREMRGRRKGFYLRNGMIPQPFLIRLFGVEMEILTFRCQVNFKEYYSLYQQVYQSVHHEALLSNVQFLRELEREE